MMNLVRKMRLFKTKQEREMERELKYQEIMREIAVAENRLKDNRREVEELGKEAVRIGDENLINLAAASLKRIDESKVQLMRAKAVIGLMHAQGITAKTLEPFFEVVKNVSELAESMGIADAARAKEEIEKASRKMENFDIIYNTTLRAISTKTVKTPEIEPYIQELKAKAMAEEEQKMPREVAEAKKGIEELKKVVATG
jgi:hypothetical protein